MTPMAPGGGAGRGGRIGLQERIGSSHPRLAAAAAGGGGCGGGVSWRWLMVAVAVVVATRRVPLAL